MPRKPRYLRIKEWPPLTSREAAQVLKVSARHVCRLIKAGKLRAQRPGRDYLLEKSDLLHRPRGMRAPRALKK